LAKELVHNVDAAIGMDGEISDDGAIAFSRGFYSGVSAGLPIGRAVELGMAELHMHCPNEKELPKLFCRHNINAATLLVVDVEQI
jgi:hypothetical protein